MLYTYGKAVNALIFCTDIFGSEKPVVSKTIRNDDKEYMIAENAPPQIITDIFAKPVDSRPFFAARRIGVIPQRSSYKNTAPASRIRDINRKISLYVYVKSLSHPTTVSIPTSALFATVSYVL